MNNKYQEAKDNIKNYCRCVVEPDEYSNFLMQEDLETLQELIDKYETQKHNIEELNKVVSRLEKALDKACERLSETYPKYDFEDKKCLVRKIFVPKEQWKEYLLEESESK